MTGVIKESQLKLLKEGKGSNWSWGQEVLKESPPMPPENNFYHTLCIAFSSGTFMSRNMKNLG